MKIQRTTHVISISLPTKVAFKLEEGRKKNGQSRSAYISSLIDQATEEKRWQEIYKLGEKTARKFKITSEEDINRILHES